MVIDWAAAAVQHQYEDMVAVLLQMLYPDALHIDGAGGDEGRDVILETDAGLVIFECKRFADRLTESRKKQIRRSLDKAAKHKPLEWHLLMPINPTPAEMKFLERLQKRHNFKIDWRGKTWLNAQMATYPVIVRYFLGNAEAEVLELIRDLPIAVEQLSSAADALPRIERLHRRLNELDVHYEYALSTGAAAEQTPPERSVLSVHAEGLRIDVIPRYRGALSARPIRGNFTVEFGTQDAEVRDAFLNAMDFGDSVDLPPHTLRSFQLNAPGGLGGDLSGGTVHLGGVRQLTPHPVSVRARVLGPDDRLVQEIMLMFNQVRGGRRGGTLYGEDDSGLLQVELRFERECARARVNFSYRPRSLPPSTIRPVATFLAAWEQGRRVELTVGTPPRRLMGAELGADEALLPGWFPELADALELVQRRARAAFEMPVDLTRDEVHEIFDIAAELEAEGRHFTWRDLNVHVHDPGQADEGLEMLLSSNGGALLVVRELTWLFRGQAYDMGLQRVIFEHAVVDDLEHIRQRLASTGEAHVRLVPGRSNKAVARLVDPDDPTVRQLAVAE